MQNITDNTLPEGSWEFDNDVTAVFDDMLARSIPQYAVMRQAVSDLAANYLPATGTVIDLGCSRGEALKQLATRRPDARYIGIEISDPMVVAASESAPFADIRKLDLRRDYPQEFANVTLCILTLQFTPIEYRQQILRRVYEHTSPNGVLVIVEKIIGATAQIDSEMVRLYYGLKGSNGYSPEQIERKRLSLEGVLVPVTAKWNEELLYTAGFTQVDCFWRWMNFAGWIAVQ